MDFELNGIDKLDALLKNVAKSVDVIRGNFRGSTPSTLFHYTNSAGLRGIISGRRIFATHYRYLNDASELDYGRFVLTATIEKLITKNSDHVVLLFLDLLKNNLKMFDGVFECYIACFCTEDDLLNQWRHYSGSGGYALGFSTLELARPSVDSTAPEHDFLLREVIYDTTQQSSILEELLTSTTDVMKNEIEGLNIDERNKIIVHCCQFVQLQLPQYLTTFKHPAFEAEREWRLCHLAISEESQHVLFRDGQFGLTPYVELAPRSECQDRLPLLSVTHAPTNNASNVRFALSALLRSQGYLEVRLAGSVLPMRIS